MKTHVLKSLPEYFDPASYGPKNFEIRLNDRDFKVGDRVQICLWDGKKFVGQHFNRYITYITDFQQKPGYVVMATSRWAGGSKE